MQVISRVYPATKTRSRVDIPLLIIENGAQPIVDKLTEAADLALKEEKTAWDFTIGEMVFNEKCMGTGFAAYPVYTWTEAPHVQVQQQD